MKVTIRWKPEEIAALVRATQERQVQENFIPMDEAKKAVCVTINFSGEVKRLVRLLQAKDDTEPEAPEKPSN